MFGAKLKLFDRTQLLCFVSLFGSHFGESKNLECSTIHLFGRACECGTIFQTSVANKSSLRKTSMPCQSNDKQRNSLQDKDAMIANDPYGGLIRKGAIDMGFIHAFVASLSVIIVSELGDKTFFIAAIMAMRHSRGVVFAGAISALFIMTVMSGA